MRRFFVVLIRFDGFLNKLVRKQESLNFSRFVYFLVGPMLLFGFIGNAAADIQCRPTGTQPKWLAEFKNVTPNPNAAIGSVVASASVTGGPLNIRCDDSRTVGATSYLYMTNNISTPSSGSGYKLQVVLNGVVLNDYDAVYAGINYTTAGDYVINPLTVSVRIVKTGNPVFQSGNPSSGFANLAMRTSTGNGGAGTAGYLMSYQVNSFVSPTPTCSVTTSNVNIPLGSVKASTFGSVGSVSGASATQNVSLSCQYSPSVSMTLSGTQAGSGLTNVVALTSASTAEGIGVQILRNGTPLTIGTKVSVSSAAGGTLNVPIAARYYRTGDVKAGSANASPTLQFSYN